MMENTTFAAVAAASISPSVRLQMNRYGILFFIILGNIGSLFSVGIYRRRKFSASSCTPYLLAVSINTFLFVNFALLTRLLEAGFTSINFTSKSLAFCRIRSFLYHAITTYHMFSLVMASFDRFLVTRLMFYRKRTSNIICLLLAVLCFSAYAHIFKYFIIDSRIRACGACFSTFYTAFFVWFYLSVYCLLPITLMAIFGVLTVRRVHRVRTALFPRAGTIRQREHNLLRMVITTVVLTLILTLPFGVQNLYLVFGPPTNPENTFSAELRRILEDISRLLLYSNHTLAFYINMVASRGFRQEFTGMIESWRKRWRKQPIDQTTTNNIVVLSSHI
jgi:hypothetical protein